MGLMAGRPTLSIPGHNPDDVRKQLDRRALAPDGSAPSAQTVQKDAMIKAINMLLDDEREQTDDLLAQMRSDIEDAKGIAERTTDKALKSLIDRLDRYADRASEIDAARKTTEERLTLLCGNIDKKLGDATAAQARLEKRQAELDTRVNTVAADAQLKQIVPQLLAANMANLRSVCNAILHTKSTDNGNVTWTAPEGYI